MSKVRTVDYYFTLLSPWAYLGHARLLDSVQRHGAELAYHPVSLSEVFPNSGGLPLAKRHPSRQVYRMVELKRWRAHLGLDFHLEPAFWPFAAAQADRTVLALVGMRRSPEPWVSRAFRAIWHDQLDLSDPGTLAMLLAECGEDAEAVLDYAASQDVARQYEQTTRAALAAGVFGSPTYLLKGEPFWGQDRLEFLDRALAEDRPPILP